MDTSLSDFQEKKIIIARKDTKKPATTKAKPKKAPKKIRGQKDIRSALKSKKNELIAFSNDFEKVCRKSGIDVDSEQLQLAIALSKSLQQGENKEEDSQAPGSSSQERIGKIRTTLQEYGFVVPEVKITATKRRKVKKHRKNYKLLQTTEEEKQELISNRYSKVLFDNLVTDKSAGSSNIDNTRAKLYHIATNITYKEIGDNSILYIEDLIEKLPSVVGCLLKNWSEIPGRPISPVCETAILNFSNIECSQEELDIILSGPLKSCREFVASKYQLYSEQKEDIVTDTKDIKGNITMGNDMDKTQEHNMDEPNHVQEHEKESTKGEDKVIDIEAKYNLPVPQNLRSCSPDMFDDEVSSIIVDEHNPTVLSQELPSRNFTKDCSEVMDLTECLIVNSQRFGNNTHSQQSQGTNVTKRRSNDFMEMTKCVTGSSQPIREEMVKENIDLTQHSDNENEVTIITDNKEVFFPTVNTNAKSNDIASMDLTQSSESSEDLPFVQISGKKSLDDTIIMNDEEYAGIKCKIGQSCSNTPVSDEMPSKENKKLSSTTLPRTIYIDSDNEDDIEQKDEISEDTGISPIKHIPSYNLNLSCEQENQDPVTTCDLTKEEFKNPEEINLIKSRTDSFFDEFIYRHSESSKENTDDHDVLHIEESPDNSIGEANSPFKSKAIIDISQELDEEDFYGSDIVKSPKKLLNSSSLGKIGDVSIDYDDLYDNMMRKHCSSESQLKSTSLRYNSTVLGDRVDRPSANSDLVSNSSQTSELFEISDKELDYSLHKSKLDDNPKENFDFGGISVMDNLPDLPSLRQSINSLQSRTLNRSLSDSFDVKSTNGVPETTDSISPRKKSKEVLAKTPKNGEYIIKTDQVTPMQDYEAMDTPERNRELSKYGLKPFKRKRAIQLLTHLYNQTHPIVETLSTEDLPSPSKKIKANLHEFKSPTKRISPKKIPSQKNIVLPSCSSAEANLEGDKENDIYDENKLPDIKDVACSEDDWVLQNREKAKLHSCRVPLHIAFHNYVTSRSRLREAILRYEPVNIDVIHKGLVANGFRYDPKDLLKFMDKKCITVKTADNNARNNRNHY